MLANSRKQITNSITKRRPRAPDFVGLGTVSMHVVHPDKPPCSPVVLGTLKVPIERVSPDVVNGPTLHRPIGIAPSQHNSAVRLAAAHDARVSFCRKYVNRGPALPRVIEESDRRTVGLGFLVVYV